MNTLPKTLPKFIWHFIKQHWKLFTAAQLACLGWTLDFTLWPVVMLKFVDAITNYNGEGSAWGAISTVVYFGLALTLILEALFRSQGFFKALFFPKMEADIRMAMFQYVQKHSHNYFSNHLSGTLSNKIADMPQTVNRILEMVTSLFVPVSLAIIIALILFAVVSPPFALILGAWLIVHTAICIYWAKPIDNKSNIHSDSRSTLTGKIVDSLSNHINTRLFSRSRYENEYIKSFQKDEMVKHLDSAWTMEIMKFWLGVNSFIGINLGMMGYMIYSWLQGNLSAGEVVFIFTATWNITMMAWLAGLDFPLLAREIGVGKQALSVIQDTHEILDAPDAKELKVKFGNIQFDHVNFKYIPEQNVFVDMNVLIKGGEKVGLVGFSGSGKSTFVNLILRYYDVNKGHILIDGQDVSKVTQESLRNQIALIPQDTSLFHRSLYENIKYGSLHSTQEDVVEAAKKAHCHEFIIKLPEGYDTLVGERGVKLSGGQRQRIAIARAILKNAPILILDEATSSLDSVTERDIQEGLHTLMKNRTTIVIAHRLSTLRDMDRILVFKDGKIIEEGNHETLLKAKGHYAYLWSMQAGGFLPEHP